jgi:UDP-N-acetylglucosamine:LPS N-acetylglucosamine transferase
MAVVLAYTSPAIGHLFPFCALLGELAARGHEIHVRTLESSAAAGWGLPPSVSIPGSRPCRARTGPRS